jgi:hypothetical protein
MKSTLAILLLVLFSQASWSQSRVTSRLPQDHNLTGEMSPINSGFGLKAGFNYANVRGTGASAIPGGIQLKPSFHAGIFAQFRLSNRFSVQPELLYSRQGYRVATPGTTPPSPTYEALKLDYINLPVLLVFNLSYRWSIHAGPQAGLLLTVREDDREAGQDAFRALDLGAAIGTEFRFGRFRVGARYNHGFHDIMINSPNVRNAVMQVYTGVSF